MSALAGRSVLPPARRDSFIPSFDDAAQIRTAHLVLPDHFDRDLIARLDDISYGIDVSGCEIGDMYQPLTPVLQLDERAEVDGAGDLGLDYHPHFHLRSQILDPLFGCGDRLGLGRSKLDRAIVLDIDRRSGLLDDPADHLSSRPDYESDLLLRNGYSLKQRCVWGEVITRRGDRPIHLIQDCEPGLLGLLKRLAQGLASDSAYLDIELEPGDPVPRPHDLEVHIAVVVFRAHDVGQDDATLRYLVLDHPHCDPGDRFIERHAAVHQRQ